MIEILEKLGYTTAVSFFLAGAFYFVKSSWESVRNKRLSEAEKILDLMVAELDNALSKFYLPLSERFVSTRHINEKMSSEAYPEESEKKLLPNAPRGTIRDITVNKILLPLNSEIRIILLENINYKDQRDTTNYEEILSHYLIWQSLEESKNEGVIETYDGSNILVFPYEQVHSCISMTNFLLEQRKRLRKELLSIRGSPDSLKINLNKKERQMKKQDLNFKKSSFSANYQPTCVGVAAFEGKIVVTNTNTKTEFVDFTSDEWDAFIQGVKAGEFDEFAK